MSYVTSMAMNFKRHWQMTGENYPKWKVQCHSWLHEGGTATGVQHKHAHWYLQAAQYWCVFSVRLISSSAAHQRHQSAGSCVATYVHLGILLHHISFSIYVGRRIYNYYFLLRVRELARDEVSLYHKNLDGHKKKTGDIIEVLNTDTAWSHTLHSIDPEHNKNCLQEQVYKHHY